MTEHAVSSQERPARAATGVDLLWVPVWAAVAGWFVLRGFTLGTVLALTCAVPLVALVLAMSVGVVIAVTTGTTVPKWVGTAGIVACVCGALIGVLPG